MKQLKFGMIFMLSTLILGGTPVFCQDLMTNGGFENWTEGIPDGWDVESSVDLTQESTTVFAGLYSLGLEATSSSNRGVYQIIPVNVGDMYEFSVYLNGVTGNNDLGIYLNWLDGSGGSISGVGTYYNSSAGSWEKVTTGEIEPPEGAVSARCRIRCYANSALGGYADSAVFMNHSGGPTNTPGPPTSTPTATPTGPTPTPTPFEGTLIYDIQYTEDPTGDSPFVNQTVVTSGVVTAYEDQNWSVFIQDGAGPWSGIMIYNPLTTLAPGDLVIVEGVVKEYYGLTEISPVNSVTVVSSGNPIPEPRILETGEEDLEPWESVLVQFEDCVVTDDSMEYGEWKIDDGTGDMVVHGLFEYAYVPVLDDNLDYVRGLLNYSYSVFKVEPRWDNDIWVAGQDTPTPTPTGPTPTPPPPTPTPTGPTPTPPPVDAIKINEVYINPTGTDVGCYVELYFPGGASLDGYTLVGVNGNGGTDYNEISLDGYAIPATGYFVIAQDNSVAGSNLIDSNVNYQNGPDNIQLRYMSEVVDAIGYGDFSDAEFAGEGEPAPAYFSGEHSHSRIPDGNDSGNNLDDFVSGELTPGEENIPDTGQPTATPTSTVPTDTPTGPTPTPTPFEGTPIYDIQYTEDPTGDSPFVNQTVVTSGVVTAYEDQNWNVFIQDGAGPWSGIMIYNPSTTLAPGDLVIVEGVVKEYYGLTEISPVNSVTVVSSGNPIPEPRILDTGEEDLEPWEGVLVQFEDCVVTDDSMENGEWKIDDGTGDMVVHDLFEYAYVPVLDDNLDYVRGPLNYSYSVFKVEPRWDDDIWVTGQDTPTPTPTGPTPTPPPPTPTPTGPTPTPPPVDAIKINEVYINPLGTDVGCYVELYFPGGASLDGYTLVGVNGNGGTDYNEISLDGYAIPATGYFVIAQDNSVAGSNLIDSNVNYQNGPDNIQLRYMSEVVDAIGYGDFSDAEFAGEGEPAPAYFSGEHSHSRIPDGNDSDDNLDDFVSGELTPGEANIPEAGQPTATPTGPVPTDTPTGPTPTPPDIYNIKINEIHVNPDGPDVGCFVELYYPGEPRRISLAGYYLIGINGFDGSEYARIPLSGEINESGFYVIGQDDQVPNADMINELVDFQNGSDSILLQAGPVVVDAIGYGSFDAGEVFAGEGAPVPYPTPTENRSLSRLPDGEDTDDNAVDFQWGELTAGEPNVAAGEATHTPVPPTDTPTVVPPTGTPVPTETPVCEKLGVSIVMPSNDFGPNDEFYINVEICNPTDDVYTDIPLLVILDVKGEYFYAPLWVEFSYYLLDSVDAQSLMEQVVLDPFLWPENAGTLPGVWFYAGMVLSDFSDLLGDLDMKEFGWHE